MFAMQQTAGRMSSTLWSDCRASLVGWGAYIGVVVGYCALYTIFVEAAQVDLMQAAAWPLREWGGWLALTPLVCAGLRALHAASPGRRAMACRYVLLGGGALVVTLGCRVGLDVLDGGHPVSSLVYFLPRHAAALALVVLAWHVLGRRGRDVPPVSPSVAQPPGPAPGIAPDDALPMPGTLLVSQGRQERLIQVRDIDVVSAAGNYVDIRCGDTTYLLRASLTQLEQALPPGHFVRVHRSHLVNVASIAHMSRTAAGNGQVRVRGGHEVPMSKKYRALLKASCTIPAADA